MDVSRYKSKTYLCVYRMCAKRVEPGRGARLWLSQHSNVHADTNAEVVVLAGHGKRNGRLWIGDGSVDSMTVPSLRHLKRGRKSSQPRVETRPTHSSVAMDRIQVCSSSLVIYISLDVFYFNIHDIARTKYRLRWRSKIDCDRRPRPSLSGWRSS
jgi:hypothetical protein